MDYRQKTIHSMAFYLIRRWDGIQLLDAIKELKVIWPEVELSDMVKAYHISEL